MAAQYCREFEACFRVHYLFVHQAANWFVHATVRLAQESPTVESLALFSYPASRFGRGGFDLPGTPPPPRPSGSAPARPARVLAGRLLSAATGRSRAGLQ